MTPTYLRETVFFSSLIKNKEFFAEWETISEVLKRHRIKIGFLEGTRGIWCRDYMPVPVSDSEYVQFRYNSSYLQDPKYDAERTIPENIPERLQFSPKESSIILDGGNVVRQKNKVIISERAKTDNPGWNEIALQGELERILQAEVLWIPDHGEERDMTGHADGLVRFLDDTTLLVNDQTKEYSDWVRRFNDLMQGKGYNVINVPFFESPDPSNDESAIGIYLNYLEVADLVIVPTFYSDSLTPYFKKKVARMDEDAIGLFKKLFPGRKVEPVKINKIGEKGGLINCITWNIKTPVPLFKDLKLVPVYASGDHLMLVLSKDFAEGVSVDDSYAVTISLRNPASTPVRRGQNFLRFDPMEPIALHERQHWIEELNKKVSSDLINKMALDIEEAILKDEMGAS